MKVELWDMDVPYTVGTDINATGKTFVWIRCNGEDVLALDKDQCLELARVLTFLANELKDE